MADPLTLIAAGLQVAGTIAQSNAQRSAGEAAQTEANYKAQQADVNAGQERAASQRKAMEQTRQAALVSSRARAVGAASGAGTDTNIESNIAGEGEYRSLAALYEGEDKARGLVGQASLSRFEGDQAAKAANSKATSTLFSGFTSAASGSSGSTLWNKYGWG